MQITPVRSVLTHKTPVFKSHDIVHNEEVNKEGFSDKQVCGAVLATALSAALAVSAVAVSDA